MVHVKRADVRGDPNIGLYLVATEKYVIAPEHLKELDVFNVPVIVTTVARTQLNGIFMAGNSHGLLVSDIIMEREYEQLDEQMQKLGTKIHLLKLEDKHTAIGNLILCNDHVAIISKILKKHAKEIEQTLKVPVVVSEVFDVDIIGSMVVSTNRGFVSTINTDEVDFEWLKTHLKVTGDIGTVNFGGPFIKSGLVANTHGFLIGKLTTGPEVGRIDQALGFLD